VTSLQSSVGERDVRKREYKRDAIAFKGENYECGIPEHVKERCSAAAPPADDPTHGTGLPAPVGSNQSSRRQRGAQQWCPVQAGAYGAPGNGDDAKLDPVAGFLGRNGRGEGWVAAREAERRRRARVLGSRRT
jgi:hypothetical protein